MSRITGKAGTLILKDSTGRKLEVNLADWEIMYNGCPPGPVISVTVLEWPDGA